MSDRRPHGVARHNIVSGDVLCACGGSSAPDVLI
jgi:hypothetical protein